MALEVFMPRLTHDMQAGRLIEWYKKEGDEVKKGEPLFAVETDKATVDVEAEAAGVLRGLCGTPGDEVPVGEVMAWICAAHEKAPSVKPRLKPPAAPAPTGVEEIAMPPEDKASPSSSPWAGGRIVASPLARRVAKQYGADLSQITGRGPHGRITQADVQAYLDQQPSPEPYLKAAAGPTEPVLSVVEKLAEGPASTVSPGEAPYDVVPLSRLRQSTGECLLASVRTAPHFDLEVEVDMSEARRWRARSAEGGQPKVSYTALLIKIVAQALRNHRQVNAAFVAGELWVYREINIGIAMATPEGLVVPVIHRADEMSLGQIQEALNRWREKAQELRFTPKEFAAGTFTVSNLGMYGIDAFRAIINPPQAAILAVGRIAERPIGKDGQVVLHPTARLVLSVDHRVLDGAQAALFLTTVRRLLENPYLLL